MTSFSPSWSLSSTATRRTSSHRTGENGTFAKKIKVMNFSGAFCPSDYSAGSPCRSLKKSLSLQFPRPFRLSVSRSLNFSLFQQQSATRSPGIQEHKQEEEEEEEEDYDWGERQQTTMQLVEGTYGLFLILLVFACLYLPAYSLTKNKKQGKIRKAIS